VDVTTNRTADDERKAREVEYGTYTAAEDIHVDGVLAFKKGDPVPVSHVKQYSLQRAVENVKSADSDKATAAK
jgi:hypothetical protein